jgi:hypothetical protein
MPGYDMSTAKEIEAILVAIICEYADGTEDRRFLVPDDGTEGGEDYSEDINEAQRFNGVGEAVDEAHKRGVFTEYAPGQVHILRAQFEQVWRSYTTL